MKSRYSRCKNFIPARTGKGCLIETATPCIPCSKCSAFAAKVKYRNQPVTIDGHKFPSKKEADRYSVLKLLEGAGEIKGLELQPKFELQPAFDKDGVHYRPIIYKADFKYKVSHTGEVCIEDTKGFRTKEYELKKKLFEYKYPGMRIKEL